MSEEFENEKLDNPFVVHKESDASYFVSDEVILSENENNSSSNLVRHRFRKVKKKKKKAPLIIILIVILVALFVLLYYNGVIGNRNNKVDPDNSQTNSPTSEETTVSRFSGVITVKKTYIFFEGEEVDGIEGLRRAIKYLDSGTKFVIQDEDADPVFLSEEILPLLDEYNIKYDPPKYIISSGLKSQYEE